ncbi:antitoxin [Microbacterium sp. STN6]|uniref:FitA-like ribbon-helix-helix domain-containing protein n=1 Tax=Microbacterium sp. STN6 TaxID=2995588 RepID=UPI00226084E5|nr:antitoxin [Microbacterium sp. STN6]MCX7522595.1 antitoxin [Microbacterium sp. STN6]
MSRMLQVRNLPDEVHAKLKERAAAARMSMSDYVAEELAQLVRYRSNAEIVAAARERLPRVDPDALAKALDDSRDER